jgi:hypothetical protein
VREGTHPHRFVELDETLRHVGDVEELLHCGRRERCTLVLGVVLELGFDLARRIRLVELLDLRLLLVGRVGVALGGHGHGVEKVWLASRKVGDVEVKLGERTQGISRWRTPPNSRTR